MKATKSSFSAPARRLRKEKRAIDTRFVKHVEQWLERLQKICGSARVKSINGAVQRIGRLLEGNQRAASLFDIRAKERNEIIHVNWTLRSNDNHWERISEDRYLLRTDVKDWTPEDLWKVYIRIGDAEAAFRVQKDDLKFRPV